MTQVSEAAYVRPPVVLAIHAGAAQQSFHVGAADATAAWAASGLPELEAHMKRLLTEQAQSLRAVRLADQVRAPLTASAAIALTSASENAIARDVCAHRLDIDKEEADLTAAISAGRRRATRLVRAQFSRLDSKIDDWAWTASKDAQDPSASWAEFLAHEDLTDALTTFLQTLEARSGPAGLLLDMEARLDEAIAKRRVGIRQRKRGSRWRLVGIAILGAIKAVANSFLGRGKGALVKSGSRKIPFLGWALIAADGVGGGIKEVVQNIGKSKINTHNWQQDAATAARAELRKLQAAVVLAVEGGIDQAAADAANHYATAALELAQAGRHISSLERYADIASSFTGEVDEILVRRLLAISGVDPACVVAVKRMPNRFLTVHVTHEVDRARVGLEATLGGCAPGTITVERARRSAKVLTA